MSKLVSSEFQSWESLYWPEGVPRYVDVSLPQADLLIRGSGNWQYASGGRTLGWDWLSAAASDVKSKLEGRGSRCLSLEGDDLLAGLLGELLVLSRISSVELVQGTRPSCGLSASISVSGDNSRPSISFTEGSQDSWSIPSQATSYLSISLEGRRVIYSAEALWGAAKSLSAFLGLESEKGIAVVGAPFGEFELSAAALSIATGVRVMYSKDGSRAGDYTAVFIGASAVGSIDGKLPKGLSYAGVEGPLSADITRKIERSLGYPVLQMYGVSGRGILFSNPKDFNVHGSVGIAVTNVDAVISEVLEASWYRGRRLLGPGEEGELAVKGSFIDISFNAGDQRQRPIQVRISGKNQQWLGVGVLGKMDENGYLYPGGRSFA
ncbi:MAG TPA: hypothetical protein ENO38_03395 [Nitrososphaeria archaeon]|jgi:hypothetical protein|nr:hypothetical protein [Conexivisphaerales archaeon]HEU16699.1 hypothetical protein [Nitrososphaeria archaeon]